MSNEPRTDLLAHLREQIQSGTYITTGKLEVVCQRILEQLEDKDAQSI